MADSYLERVAGELADMALADEERTGDEKIINEIAEVLGSSSQTLQEAYLTAVRVRRAEARARAILVERGGGMMVSKRRLLTDETGKEKEKRDPTQFERPRREPEKKDAPDEAQSEATDADVDDHTAEDDADVDMFDDVMDMLDSALTSAGSEAADEKKITPSKPKR